MENKKYKVNILSKVVVLIMLFIIAQAAIISISYFSSKELKGQFDIMYGEYLIQLNQANEMKNKISMIHLCKMNIFNALLLDSPEDIDKNEAKIKKMDKEIEEIIKLYLAKSPEEEILLRLFEKNYKEWMDLGYLLISDARIGDFVSAEENQLFAEKAEMTAILLEHIIENNIKESLMIIEEAESNIEYSQRLALLISLLMTILLIILSIFVKIDINQQVKNITATLTGFNTSLSEKEAQLRLITDNMSDYVAKLDTNAVFQYVSPSYIKNTGDDPQKLIGKCIFDFIHPDDLELAKKVFNEAVLNKANASHSYRIINYKKEYVWIESTASYILDDNGQVESVLTSTRDIDERKKSDDIVRLTNEELRAANEELIATEEELRYQYEKLYNLQKDLEESEAQYRKLINNMRDVIFEIDAEGKIVFLSKKAEVLSTYTIKELKNKNFLDFVHEDDEQNIKEFFLGIRNGLNIDSADFRFIVSESEYKWVRVRTNPIINNNEFLGLTGVLMNIDVQRKNEEKINYLSLNDRLTGLYNRAYFEEELIRIDTEENLPISIIMLDLNGLKLVNDTLGYKEGDKLLVLSALLLKQVSNSTDVVARFGGDEFAIIMPKTSPDVAQTVLKQLEEKSEEINIGGIKLSISMGTATKNKKQENIYKVLTQSEENMYNKKLLESKSTRSHVVISLLSVMSEKTFETKEHCQRLADYCVAIAGNLNLRNEVIEKLRILATMHDIGKVAIPEQILAKPGKLNEEEREEMEKHSEIGFRIASTTPEFQHIAEEILCHHERWDGKGYPKGLAREEIPIESRILAVVDSYDAMTEDRVYRKGMSKENAINELIKNKGTQFDPLIVDVFLEKVLDIIDFREEDSIK